MKNAIIATLLLGLLLFGCASQSQSTPTPQSQSPAQVTMPAAVGALTGMKEFTITAKQFEFSPSTITVNKGDKVRLKITSQDTTHGFALPDFGVEQTLDAGKEVMVEFTADKAGTFEFRCFNYCGSGHGGMSGKLVVNG